MNNFPVLIGIGGKPDTWLAALIAAAHSAGIMIIEPPTPIEPPSEKLILKLRMIYLATSRGQLTWEQFLEKIHQLMRDTAAE